MKEFDVEKILSQYGLKEDDVETYLDQIVQKNQTETAKEVGITKHWLGRHYKQQFSEMGEAERAFLIGSLMMERFFQLTTGTRARFYINQDQ